jgi:hypothetical protein
MTKAQRFALAIDELASLNKKLLETEDKKVFKSLENEYKEAHAALCRIHPLEKVEEALHSKITVPYNIAKKHSR